MRIQGIFFLVFLVFTACDDNDQDDRADKVVPSVGLDYRQKMREFVIGISQYSKAVNPNFSVIPQNGIELISSSGSVAGPTNVPYLNAIDGNGQESLFYGHEIDDHLTSVNINSYLTTFLDISKNAGKSILVIDYCSTPLKVMDSYAENTNKNYISFAANQRKLNTIPHFPNPINHENNLAISNISQAKNFLYLINGSNFSSKADLITAVTSTNYDVIIVDLFKGGSAFTASEVSQLRNKANGGKRLVFSYLSIGEAENYRYYWQPDWNTHKPDWLDVENPNWPGNFKVKYWNPEWQQIIYGNDNSYLKKILDSGFNGVYLDVIDAFDYYEQKSVFVPFINTAK